MHFKPEDRAEPYGPVMIANGRRSLIPDDLRGEQSNVFAALAPTIKNAGLRALLADIAWLNNRRLAASAQLAISSFCEAVRLVLDGKAKLYFDDETAGSHNGVEMLRRACQIAQATGWKEPEAAQLRTLIRDLDQSIFDERAAGNYLNIGELNADYRIVEPIDVARHAEALAQGDAVHPDVSRSLWELAARSYRKAEAEEEKDRCLREAAECYVKMAAAADFKGMTAAHWLMEAIDALRKVKDTKERREELEKMLRRAQSFISDEMGTISTEMDLGEIIDSSRKLFEGLTLAQAFIEFARIDRSPSPEQLREDATKHAEEHPVQTLISMSIHDAEGKVVAKSPGVMGDADARDTAIMQIIAQLKSFRRNVTTSGVIEPARRLINAEHPLSERHFRPIVQMSPFVPAGHQDLSRSGLHVSSEETLYLRFTCYCLS